MNNLPLERMKRRQKSKRVDAAQRIAMISLLAGSLAFITYELIKGLI